MNGRAVAGAACLCLLPVPALAALTVQEGAPPGFEQLDQPRFTVVRLYYGGNLLGDFPAHYTASTLVFDTPDEVVAAVPHLAGGARVREVLSGTLDAHASRVCHGRNIPGCGTLTPEVAGVIFDERTLSAELFIHHSQLSVADETGPKYLPLPERSLSSVYGFGGAATGTDETDPSYALSNQSVFAYGEMRLSTQSTVSNDGLRFDTAALSIDRHGMEAAAGLFRSRGMQLVADRDMAGVSLSTSLRTRLDHRKTEGNDIVLYLPRRAIVSVYREGRIYSSRAYEAGNQSIDTSDLPEGAYNITLRIQETDGGEREETRFFAKAPELPPEDDPTYYLQAGVARKAANDDSTVPELTGRMLLRLGTVQRVSENAGLDISALGLNDRGALETGLFMIDGGSRLRVTALGSTRGDSGAQASYLYNMDGWNIAIDARRIWANDPMEDDNDPAIGSLEQATASLGYLLTPDLTLGMRGNHFSQLGTRFRSYGSFADWYIWREGESLLSLTADAGKTNGETTASAFLRFSMRFGKYGLSGSGGYTRNPGEAGASAQLRGWYDDTQPGHALLAGIGMQADPRGENINADMDWRGAMGRARATAQHSWNDGGSVLGYGGSFQFNIAQAGSDVHFGGDRTDTSALLVSTSGKADVPMKVLINGNEQGTVEPGRSLAVYVPPYQTYHVRLVPAQHSMIDYDTGTRRVTLYPGNVARVEWEIQPSYVVLAKLVTPDGEPLARALLQEKQDITTDARGRLQAELQSAERLTFITADDTACETTLPEVAPKNGVLIYPTPLVCEPILVTGAS